MLSSDIARIKSAPENQRAISVVAGIIAVVLTVVVAVVFWPRTTHVRLGFPDRSYQLEVAKSQETLRRGLGGRDSLAKDRGMLFIFENDDKPCMWMKDMRFPLDILWLDAEQRVVHMARNISPLTYPRTFCSRVPAKYVVELNAGTTAAAHVYVGQRLSF